MPLSDNFLPSSIICRIVDHAPIGIAAFAFDGNCVFINHTAAEILGISQVELKNSNFFSDYPWKELDPEQIAPQICQQGGKKSFTASITRNETRHVSGSFSLLDNIDPPYLIAIFCDVSDKIVTEQILQSTQAIAVDNLKRALIAERKTSNISEETRRMIGRELHDDLGQHLTGLVLIVENMAYKLQSNSHPEANEALRITKLLQEAVEKTRLLARQVFPLRHHDQSLENRISILLRKIEVSYTVRCNFYYSKITTEDTDIILNVYHITQEAINNSIKHGNANQIQVKLYEKPDSIILEVIDNGSGLHQNDETTTKGLGMHIMRHRCIMLGGSLEYSSEPNGGTKVVATLPLSSTPI